MPLSSRSNKHGLRHFHTKTSLSSSRSRWTRSNSRLEKISSNSSTLYVTEALNYRLHGTFLIKKPLSSRTGNRLTSRWWSLRSLRILLLRSVNKLAQGATVLEILVSHSEGGPCAAQAKISFFTEAGRHISVSPSIVGRDTHVVHNVCAPRCSALV